jgi:hypothetical protein
MVQGVGLCSGRCSVEGLMLLVHKFIYAEGANVISELALFPTFAFLFPLELSVKEHTNRPVLLMY